MRTAHEMVEWQHYMTHDEVDAMMNLTGQLPMDAIIVKIGAGAGTDTLAILETSQDLLIFSIDIAAGEQPALTNEHLRLEECGYDKTGCVIRIWGDSKIVGLKWPISIDWLHVDGDHSAEGITADISEWYRHVKLGGFISFHDYGDPHWPAVKEVVDNMMYEDDYLSQYSADCFRVYQKT